MLVEEFTYQLQVTHLSKRNNISENKSRNFIKAYRRLLKTSLKEGNKIEITGIATIWPSVRERVREVFDYVYTYEEQVKELSEELNMDLNETHNILKSYLRMLITKLNMGYSVKISGVVLIKPDLFDDDLFGYITRLSPTLQKPDKLTLTIKHLYGNIENREVDKENIIFRMDLDETLEPPKRLRLVGEHRVELNFVSDDVLG